MKKIAIYIFSAVFCAFAIFFASKALKLAGSSYVQTFSGATFSPSRPVLIIDPGHGGEDGGAVSPSGILESDINLDISLKMRDFAALFGISPVMTRTGADIDYPDSADTVKERKNADLKARAEFINSFDNAVLVSIHQNKFTSSEPFGAQVLYGKNEVGRQFAEQVQSALIDKLDKTNYRTASQISDTIYLMRKVECPAILVECGFLSNGREEALLQTDEYRLQLAAVIVSVYFENFVSEQGGV